MKAFVLMPFDAELDAVYRSFISKCVSAAGFEVFRADDLLNQQNILNDIVESIAESDLIIADLTGSNPNVYYELGIAHTLDKPTVLLAQDLDEVPFDLQSHRVITYGTHFEEMARAQEELSRLVSQAIEGTLKFGSPVSDAKVTPTKSQLASPRDGLQPEDTHPQDSSDEDWEDTEPGLIDHLVDMEEGFTELNELTTGIANETQTIGAKTTEITEALQESNRNPSQGSASYRRKLIRKLAKELDLYGSSLGKNNSEYRVALSKTGNSLEAILRSDLQPSDEEALRDFLSNIEQMKGGALTARDSMQSMRDVMEGLGNVERKFNRARVVVIRELTSVVENLDQTIAMTSRTQENGRKALEKLEAASAPESSGNDTAEPSAGADG